MAARPELADEPVPAADEPAARARPGWMVVAGKELAETLTSLRFAILMVLLIGAAAVPVYVASGAIRDAAEQASEASALFLAVYLPGNLPLALFFSLCVAVGGAFWGWLYHQTGSLYAPWASHLLIDAGIMAVGYDMVRGGW